MNIDKKLLFFKVFGFEKSSEISQSLFAKNNEFQWKELIKSILKMESEIKGFSEIDFDQDKMVLKIEFYKMNESKGYELDSIVNFDIMLYPSSFEGMEDEIFNELN